MLTKETNKNQFLNLKMLFPSLSFQKLTLDLFLANKIEIFSVFAKSCKSVSNDKGFQTVKVSWHSVENQNPDKVYTEINYFSTKDTLSKIGLIEFLKK